VLALVHNSNPRIDTMIVDVCDWSDHKWWVEDDVAKKRERKEQSRKEKKERRKDKLTWSSQEEKKRTADLCYGSRRTPTLERRTPRVIVRLTNCMINTITARQKALPQAHDWSILQAIYCKKEESNNHVRMTCTLPSLGATWDAREGNSIGKRTSKGDQPLQRHERSKTDYTMERFEEIRRATKIRKAKRLRG